MLVYHPLFDSKHSMLRICKILSIKSDNKIDLAGMALFDFYLAVPSVLAQFRFPNGNSAYKAYCKSLVNPYSYVSSPKNLFTQFAEMQSSIVAQMVAWNLLDKEQYEAGSGSLVDSVTVHKLVEIADSSRSLDENILEIFTETLFDLGTSGKDGLKGRSGLLEYRYDG